ncbi:MAG: glycosyltransferase [Cyanobacteria bacterium P01_H01_bin.15]
MAFPAGSVSDYINRLQERSLNYQNEHLGGSPLISIISAFYNDAKYFESAYYSIIHQTFQNFEWLIVDANSNDPASMELLKELPSRSRKVAVIHQPTNQGVSAARNLAASKAAGKYLFFMDPDDLLDPTYLEKCLLFLELNPEFSLVNSYSIGFEAEEYWWDHGFRYPRRFFEQNWVTGRLLFRKADFLALGGYDAEFRFYEDWELWLHALSEGQKAWTIPEYLDCYRRSHSGLLARSRRNAAEIDTITRTILERYASARDTLPEEFALQPYRFDTASLSETLTISNSLHRDNPGRRLLCFFPHLEIGGADKFNLDLLRHLKDRGYDITLVTTIPAEHRWYAEFYAITPDIFEPRHLGHKGHWLKLATYLIESRHIDICLVSNSYYAYYLLPFLRQRFPQLAIVDYTHTEDPGWRAGGYARVSCQMLPYLDSQVVASKYLAAFYDSLTEMRSPKLRVCPINVDTSYWQGNPTLRQEARQRLNLPPDQPILFFPARITAQKRPLMLVDIVKALRRQVGNVVVLALALGELLEPLRMAIQREGLTEHIRLLPPASAEEMRGFYAASDMLLLPSGYEGISLAIYEAMGMGLPIVASAVGGQAELVTPETGCLVPLGQGDQVEVEQYVKILNDLIQSPQRRSQLGKQARERVVNHFDLRHMADRMEEIFQEALTARQEAKNNSEAHCLAIATELLAWFNEYSEVDDSWGYICNERNYFKARVEAMETSKFWKLRKLWFKLKRRLGLTTEEP